MHRALARDRLGATGDRHRPADIAPWLTDWRGRYHGHAPALLAPASTAEVAAIVAAAARASRRRWCRRAATPRWSAARPRPPTASALILSLRRMNRIRSHRCRGGPRGGGGGRDPRPTSTTRRSGGRRFPLTLGARGTATIGGLVSTNAGGTQVLRFGTMRGLVAGVEAVLPDGSIHDGLSRAQEGQSRLRPRRSC